IELDDKANIISYEEYHPFGTTSYQKHNTTISQKRYKYNGKERDNETGMCYYGARYYAAWICRFVSVDPLQFKYPNYTPFLYAGNNPVSKIDIDGLEEGKPKTHPNVIIFISKREKTLKDIDDQAKELKNWTVITGKDIKSVSKELKKKYEGKNINNLVIRTHGSENRGAIKYNPVNGNEFTTREIHKYYKKTVTDFSRGFMNSLNDVISKVKDGGNVVFIACAAGKDENFVKTAYGFFTNKNVNIYYNNTLSSFKGRVYDVFRNFKGYKMKFGKPITRPDMPNKGWKKVLPLLPSYRIKSMNKDGTISFELKYPEPIISRSKKIIINDKKRETSCNKTLRYA
ncbi:RHS repeat domain-containing protein, partial [Vallitalea sp.]|uniref:RHS repeat domain-containing protein n=1 Tax=Vallitalea sp. TaxID=1882829 RepID=UPI0025DC68B9